MRYLLGLLFTSFILFCPYAVAHSFKKGIGVLKKNSYSGEVISKLNVSWYYTWGPYPVIGVSGKIDFVPMLWGLSRRTTSQLEEVFSRKSAPGMLLPFNEPDQHDQSNIGVSKVLSVWPSLMKHRKTLLGSPSCAYAFGPWMTKFMQEAHERNYRVDFVSVHWYGPPDPKRFESFISKVWARYKKPIWVTEFAVGGKPVVGPGRRFSFDKVVGFMKATTTWMDANPHVSRYAWFSSAKGAPWMRDSALYDSKTGRLTRLGVIYAKL